MYAQETQPEFRSERKFLIPLEQQTKVLQLITLHPAHFSEIYHKRQINNIYFDTADLAHLRENIAGVSPRKKVRIRWYNDFSKYENPTLEIKSKTGELVAKEFLPITVLNTGTKLSEILSKQKQKQTKRLTPEIQKVLFENMASYSSVLTNAYERQYYLSASGNIRLTIDTNIQFAKSDGAIESPHQTLPHMIIELKYSIDAEAEAHRIASAFPFRLTKSSKYQQGMSLCFPHVIIT